MPKFNRPARMILSGYQMRITRRTIGYYVTERTYDLRNVSAASARRVIRFWEADIWTNVNSRFSSIFANNPSSETREYQLLGRIGVSGNAFLNEHGVECVRNLKSGKPLPVCCTSCPLFEQGEYWDDGMGTAWSDGGCRRGLFLPTRTGLCEVKRKYLEFSTIEEPPYSGRQGARG